MLSTTNLHDDTKWIVVVERRQVVVFDAAPH
jgi:hypothetical protein